MIVFIEMSHMPFSVFHFSDIAYHYTTVSLTFFFTRTTRLGLCEITTSSKQPWKNMRNTKEAWCSLRGSWHYELGLLVAIWVCRSTQQEQRLRLECQWGSRKGLGKWPLDKSGAQSLESQLWRTGHVKVSTSSHSAILIQSSCFVICGQLITEEGSKNFEGSFSARYTALFKITQRNDV